MHHKANPLYWLARALDATDNYLARYDYRGGHWKVNST